MAVAVYNIKPQKRDFCVKYVASIYKRLVLYLLLLLQILWYLTLSSILQCAAFVQYVMRMLYNVSSLGQNRMSLFSVYLAEILERDNHLKIRKSNNNLTSPLLSYFLHQS